MDCLSKWVRSAFRHHSEQQAALHSLRTFFAGVAQNPHMQMHAGKAALPSVSASGIGL